MLCNEDRCLQWIYDAQSQHKLRSGRTAGAVINSGDQEMNFQHENQNWDGVLQKAEHWLVNRCPLIRDERVNFKFLAC